ncbi:MAG: histidinol-phosphate transaminase [Candidatus Fischerbacteria bacterium RBG_13_37_8]|uniref:Histidinol-phosphate aminotransferase n=1 Tax=Candidatus Fischerbacteria bacterium RBG_13_37_8 TaxID=1817863 RepID=A0A1F5V7B5_9BACT|nr:MAG: histidinol-phosphate transaminase [Candidatus Fischerbacteria bacterium RBG_13_37_8]
MKYLDLVPSNIAQIIPYEAGKPIEEVQRELKLKKVIKLASNENTFGPSPKALEAIKKFARKVNYYPEESAFYLREKLSEKHGLARENIVTANGETELISLIARCFLAPDNHAVISLQTFLMYKIAIQVVGASFTAVPLKNFAYDLKAMKDAIQPSTRLIYIANPNNPTGTYVAKTELDDLFKKLPGNVIVVLDEAYHEYVLKDDYPNGIEYFKKGYPIIILRSFSKIYALAGMRVGYAIAHSDIILAINRVRSPFSTSSIGQAAATAALDDTEFIQRSAAINKEQRDFVYRELQNSGFRTIAPSANFVWFESDISASTLYADLLHCGVIIRPLRAFGFDNSLRVTIGTPRENMMFLDALKKILKKK